MPTIPLTRWSFQQLAPHRLERRRRRGFGQDADGATLLLIHLIDHLTPADRMA